MTDRGKHFSAGFPSKIGSRSPAGCFFQRLVKHWRTGLLAGMCSLGLMALMPRASAAPPATPESLPLDLLTNAQQILALGIDGARQAPHPVHLRGVVTYPVIRRPWFYIQDATAGILIICTNMPTPPMPGQLVDVVGQAGPGLQAPHVFYADYHVIGSAPLPAPRHTDPTRLTLGEEFGQWVSLEGNVLDYLVHPDQVSLLLQEGDHHFVANISLSQPMTVPDQWLGARVEVRGVCWTEAREDGVPTTFRIHSPGTNTLTLLRRGPTNLFGWPLQTSRSLRNQTSARDQRVRVAGTVTLLLPDETLFLSDGTGNIQARLLKPITERPYISSVNADTLFMTLPTGHSRTEYGRLRPYIEPLLPGDRVEVIGTTTSAELGVMLADAEYRRLGAGEAPAPVTASGADLFAGRHENEFVTLQGRLRDRQTHTTAYGVEDLLMLEVGGLAFQVWFTSERSRALPPLPRGALLQVSGICSTEIGEWKAIRTVRILPRSRQDVAVLAQPPPWDSWHVGRILLSGVGLGIGALAWIGFLRNRVARRTAELALSNSRLQVEVEERRKAQTDLSHALEAEKEMNQLKSRFIAMVSHEFRTPLGVILSSADLLSDYLDTLTPAERGEQIADIKQCTRHMAALMEDVLLLGRVESGRMGYHPVNFDLREFCQRLIDEMRSATGGRCPLVFNEKGTEPTARGDETLLRHIFHNLLANGIKYSAPGQTVRLNVERAGEDAVFQVGDDGIGILPADQKYIFEAFYRGKNAADRPGSGLGLVVVKRCVELHGGSIQLHSTEGQGTIVTVRLPLFHPPGQTELLHRSPPPPTPLLS